MTNKLINMRIIYTLLLGICALGLQAQGVSFNESSDLDRISALQSEIAGLEEDHCEVPCGIYGDSLRVALMYEHISTVEKAMTQINEISASAKPNYNQLVRWVVNKETHAEEIQHIVSQYFLHQRIKLPSATADGKAQSMYGKKLGQLHQLLVYSMKAKQTTDLIHVEKLRETLHNFEHSYFGAGKGTHKH